jgi:hypothetical protein
MNEDYEELVEEVAPVAPAPVIPRQWSWNTETLLWVAGGVAALGFIVWFLMSYTSAKALAMAKEMANSDNAE